LFQARSVSWVHQPGFSTSLNPPPEPSQPISWMRLPEESEMRDVPPTAVVNSPDAGQLVPMGASGAPTAARNMQEAPLSPEEAKML
jgi:hypothetical protein